MKLFSQLLINKRVYGKSIFKLLFIQTQYASICSTNVVHTPWYSIFKGCIESFIILILNIFVWIFVNTWVYERNSSQQLLQKDRSNTGKQALLKNLGSAFAWCFGRSCFEISRNVNWCNDISAIATKLTALVIYYHTQQQVHCACHSISHLDIFYIDKGICGHPSHLAASS